MKRIGRRLSVGLSVIHKKDSNEKERRTSVSRSGCASPVSPLLTSPDHNISPSLEYSSTSCSPTYGSAQSLSPESAPEAHDLTILLLGDSASRKEEILYRFAVGGEEIDFIDPPAMVRKIVDVDYDRVNVEVWDAGFDNIRASSEPACEKARVLLIVFDVGCKESFEHAEVWLHNVYSHAPDYVTAVLVGHCTKQHDLPSVFSSSPPKAFKGSERCFEDAQNSRKTVHAIAEIFGVKYYEVCPETKDNLERCIHEVVKASLQKGTTLSLSESHRKREDAACDDRVRYERREAKRSEDERREAKRSEDERRGDDREKGKRKQQKLEVQIVGNVREAEKRENRFTDEKKNERLKSRNDDLQNDDKSNNNHIKRTSGRCPDDVYNTPASPPEAQKKIEKDCTREKLHEDVVVRPHSPSGSSPSSSRRAQGKSIGSRAKCIARKLIPGTPTTPVSSGSPTSATPVMDVAHHSPPRLSSSSPPSAFNGPGTIGRGEEKDSNVISVTFLEEIGGFTAQNSPDEAVHRKRRRGGSRDSSVRKG